MLKMSKHTAYVSIVSIGFTVIFLLWLPTLASNIKNITRETSSSTSDMTKKLSAQSSEIFGDTSRKIQEKLQELEKEKQQKNTLEAKVTDILKEVTRNQQLLESASSSSSSPAISITP